MKIRGERTGDHPENDISTKPHYSLTIEESHHGEQAVNSQSGGGSGSNVNTQLSTSAGSLFAIGLNNYTDWGMYAGPLSYNATINVQSAPVLIVYNVTSGYANQYNVTADDQAIKSFITDGSDSDGWGISHVYIPSGISSLSFKSPYGIALFHGSKTLSYKLASLTVEHDGHVFIVTDTTDRYTKITKNGVIISNNTAASSNDVLTTIYTYSSGWGMSYGDIPVQAGDELEFASSNAYAVIY